MGYRKTSNISRTLVGNKIVDHSDVVEAKSLFQKFPIDLTMLNWIRRLTLWMDTLGAFAIATADTIPFRMIMM